MNTKKNTIPPPQGSVEKKLDKARQYLHTISKITKKPVSALTGMLPSQTLHYSKHSQPTIFKPPPQRQLAYLDLLTAARTHAMHGKVLHQAVINNTTTQWKPEMIFQRHQSVLSFLEHARQCYLCVLKTHLSYDIRNGIVHELKEIEALTQMSLDTLAKLGDDIKALNHPQNHHIISNCFTNRTAFEKYEVYCNLFAAFHEINYIINSLTSKQSSNSILLENSVIDAYKYLQEATVALSEAMPTLNATPECRWLVNCIITRHVDCIKTKQSFSIQHKHLLETVHKSLNP